MGLPRADHTATTILGLHISTAPEFGEGPGDWESGLVLKTSRVVWRVGHAPLEWTSSHGVLKCRLGLVHHIHVLGVLPRTHIQRSVAVKGPLFTAKNELRYYTSSKNCSDFFYRDLPPP